LKLQYVYQEAPKDKLLIYDVKQGWEPLCKFLNKDVPKKPFPRKNVGGEGYIAPQQRQKLVVQGFKEFFISLIVFMAFLMSVYFYVNEYDLWQILSSLIFGLLTWHFFLKI